jgi:hypothetical protein
MTPNRMHGRVSVMMPAYNAAPYVGQAIGSVLAQTCGAWELLVVDDGSTDGTGSIASGWADPRVTVVRRSNGGEGAARNTALDLATGDFLAFLDADDAWLPDHLERALDHLHRYPADVGVYSDGVHVTADGRRLRPLSARRRGPMRGRVFDEVVRGSDVFGPPVCVVLRMDPIRDHGLRFDESLSIGTDWDFFMRVAALGPFGYIDHQTCLYRVHQDNVTARVGLAGRATQLAQCRLHAIAHPAFGACPLDVRTHVFYDLLVVLLRGEPARQADVLDAPQFAALPATEQARLLRLMASKAILHDGPRPEAACWLRRARQLAPWNPRGWLVSLAYHANPHACRRLLRWWTRGEADPRSRLPFADLAPDLEAARDAITMSTAGRRSAT